MNNKQEGFTVMEIFIIIVILCIIAAVIIPQFTKASTEAKISYLVSDLQKIRSQIELYKIQHDNLLPGQESKNDMVTEVQFVKAMTTGNDAYGPYLKKIPKNVFMDNEFSDDITCVNDINAKPTGTEGTGWWFNVATGEFRASDNRFHSQY